MGHGELLGDKRSKVIVKRRLISVALAASHIPHTDRRRYQQCSAVMLIFVSTLTWMPFSVSIPIRPRGLVFCFNRANTARGLLLRVVPDTHRHEFDIRRGQLRTRRGPLPATD